MKGAKGSIQKIIDMAKRDGISFEFKDRAFLDKLSKGVNHQGVIAESSEFSYDTLSSLLKDIDIDKNPTLLILDGVTDVHNLGSIIRSAHCFGIDGIILAEKRSANINETVKKVSCGATEYVRCARVKNLSRAIESLKDSGYWIYAADLDGDNINDVKFASAKCLVVGSEGKGISPNVRKHCDFIVTIPMKNRFNSLNVAVSSAIIMEKMSTNLL